MLFRIRAQANPVTSHALDAKSAAGIQVEFSSTGSIGGGGASPRLPALLHPVSGGVRIARRGAAAPAPEPTEPEQQLAPERTVVEQLGPAPRVGEVHAHRRQRPQRQEPAPRCRRVK